MREISIKGKTKSFSMLELLVVLAILAVLTALLWPTDFGSHKPTRMMCQQNLKQVGLALRIFAADHNDQFPMQTFVTNGGSMEFVGTGSPAPHFQTLSNYLLGNWGLLLCPADKAKQRAAKSTPISDRNISYFLGMDATCATPATILAGDRHLEVAGEPVSPGLFALTTNAAVHWTSELHSQGGTGLGGNLLFGDGHVEFSTRKLPAVIQRQNLATNRLAFP